MGFYGINIHNKSCSYTYERLILLHSSTGQSTESYHTVQSSLSSTDLVQSVVVSSAPGGIYLEPQGVTLAELPGATIQTLPGGGTFESKNSCHADVTVETLNSRSCRVR